MREDGQVPIRVFGICKGGEGEGVGNLFQEFPRDRVASWGLEVIFCECPSHRLESLRNSSPI